jgi:hypothetical protein
MTIASTAVFRAILQFGRRLCQVFSMFQCHSLTTVTTTSKYRYKYFDAQQTASWTSNQQCTNISSHIVQGHRVRDLSDSQTFFTVPLETLGAGRQLLQTPDTSGGGRRLRQAPAEAEADVLDDATIGIFSAYHDPILAEVRIFTEVHPRGVCPKFHRYACTY